MKLATLRRDDSTVAVRIEDDGVYAISAARDIHELLNQPRWKAVASGGERIGAHSDFKPAQWGPVIGAAARIVCVGLNYRDHIREMGRDEPEFPTLFGRTSESSIGPFDPLELLERELATADWEGELAVIVGAPVLRGTRAVPEDIAGYTIVNDVTIREYQYRTGQWFAGKAVEGTLPSGPVLVTADDFEFGEIRTEVDGDVVQVGRTDDVVFGVIDLLTAAAEVFSLKPGDALCMGTPAGVGHARKPPRYLGAGSVLRTSIDGIGTLENRVNLVERIS